MNGVISPRGPFPLKVHRRPFCGNGVGPGITPIPTATTWRGGLGSIYGATTSVRICDAEVSNQNKGFSDTDEVRQVGNAARRMARRAAKWLCVRGMLKTNRRNRPICFQEVTEYQQDRCPANAAASGGLADGECRYRDAVVSGGTDLPFPRRGGKWPRQGNGRSERGETAAKRGREGKGYKKNKKAARGCLFVVPAGHDPATP